MAAAADAVVAETGQLREAKPGSCSLLCKGEHTLCTDDSSISFVVDGAPARQAELVVFALHGAGQSKETFLALFKWLSKHNLTLIAPDLREHGSTTSNCSEPSLALEALAEDTFSFVSSMLQLVQEERHGRQPVQWALLGHSIGGCVAVATTELFCARISAASTQDTKASLGPGMPSSVVLLDCATDSVCASLERLEVYLEDIRPKDFDSLKAAIKWHVDRGIYASTAVAAASLKSCLTETHPAEVTSTQLKWRTNLTHFRDDWCTWANSVSKSFVSLPRGVKKVLVMSDHSLLDEPLLTAEMQGSLAVRIVQAGHQLHENASDKVAMCIMSVWQKLGVMPMQRPQPEQ